jgi:ubiquinone/menaquinone biosynthesis C-methylase UbiE
MRRKVIPELLDKDMGSAAEIADSLTDLRAINERFGGTKTTVDLLQRVAARCGCREMSVLEAAAGAGDLPLAAISRLQEKGTELRVTLLDRMWSHVQGSSLRAVCGDALQLPFRNDSFDVVSCSLFGHHLEPDELRIFAREALRVCRRAVLINDLVRSRLHYWLVLAALPLFRSRLTKHDAPASVRRAYTVEEMHSMLRDVSGVPIEISKHYLYRMGVLMWKQEPAISN